MTAGVRPKEHSIMTPKYQEETDRYWKKKDIAALEAARRS